MSTTTENTELRNQDVPQHQVGLTSSIGGLWPPEEASFGRVKGFYTNGVISKLEELEEFTGTLNKIYTQSLEETSKITRVSLRAIIEGKEELMRAAQLKDSLEVAVNLDGTQDGLNGNWLIYLGLNNPSRRSNPEELSQYIRNVEEAIKVPSRKPGEIFFKTEERGYSLEILSLPISANERNSVIDQMSNLYSRFGWNRGEVETIMDNPANIIGVAKYKDQIVSAGIAESATVPIGKKKLRIVEITEAATLEEHARNGLYTSVSTSLLKEIAHRSRHQRIDGGEVDLVFGECNGNAPGVLRTAAIQGRKFALNTTKEFGFDNRGFLCQHVNIKGSPKTTEYNDLFPAYLTKENLYGLFEK